MSKGVGVSSSCMASQDLNQLLFRILWVSDQKITM